MHPLNHQNMRRWTHNFNSLVACHWKMYICYIFVLFYMIYFIFFTFHKNMVFKSSMSFHTSVFGRNWLHMNTDKVNKDITELMVLVKLVILGCTIH